MDDRLKEIKVSVIIPSFDGVRDGNVEKLKADLNSQTLKPYEIILSIGISPNGKARNEGVKKASGDYYVFIDDDVTLGGNDLLEKLITPFLENEKIGITGPSQRIPEDSTWMQKVAARQLPRSDFPVQSELVDSDMVTHMCLCMPAQLFKDVGWENPEIIAGTDPDLRHRVRSSGYRVCVVADCWAYHPMPSGLWKILKLSYLKGKNSAIVRKTHPELVLELDNGFKKDFAPKHSLPFRIFRNLWILFYSLITFKFIRFFATIFYGAGNLAGSLKNDKN
jgi:GT2 family glycosyltransferase